MSDENTTADSGAVVETAVAEAPAAPKRRGRKPNPNKPAKVAKAPRVKKTDAEKRSSPLAGAVTADEQAAVHAAAESRGVTVSALVREACLAYVGYTQPAALREDRGLTQTAERLDCLCR